MECIHSTLAEVALTQVDPSQQHTLFQVIAEDVAAVIIHCGALPTPAKPAHRLPAFPDAASSNHDANDEHTLHETREFWGRLQPESLVPLLQSASSKGKGRMPSSYLPIESSSAGKAKRHLPSGQLPIRRPSPSLSFPSQPSQSDPEAASSSHSGPRDSLLARNSSNYSTYHESSGHSSSARDASVGGRSVHFALPAGSDSDDDDQLHGVVSGIDDKFGKGKGVLDSKQRDGNFHAEARMSKRSPPLDISFRSGSILTCPALFCPALPCPALPCPALSCPALPCPAA